MDSVATVKEFLTSMGLQSWVVQLFVVVFLTLVGEALSVYLSLETAIPL